MEEYHNDKIIVTGIPDKIIRDKLFIHFQRSKNGGGDIKSLVFPTSKEETDTAIVKFDEAKTVQSVLKQDHEMLNHKLVIKEHPPEIFEYVTVYARECSANKLKDSEKLKRLTKETGVKFDKIQMKFTGEWFQIRALEEKLGELGTFEKEDDNAHADKDVDEERLPDKKDSDMTENLTTENFPEKNLKDNCVCVDELVQRLLCLSRGNEVDNIFNQYKVSSTRQGENLMLEFLQPDDQSDVAEGINAFQKMYEKALDEVKQENYNLPKAVDQKKIADAMKEIESEGEVVASRPPPGDNIIILANTYQDCSSARRRLENLLGGQPKPRDQHMRRLPQRNDEVFFDYTFRNTGLQVSVIRGDISTQDVDAIVNAANPKLMGGGGVTGAIFRAGGREFEDYCDNFMLTRSYKKLDVGEVVHTKACGRLRCEDVIHVTGPVWSEIRPRWSSKEEKCKKIMNKLCSDLIQYANKLGSVSVAIPAIGTGIYGVPMEIFCNSMTAAIEKFNSATSKPVSSKSLKQIHLVNFSDAEAMHLASIFKQWEANLYDTAV